MKRYWVYISILAVFFAVALYLSFTSPKPIDWRETYSHNDKIPYGTYILYQLLPQVFDGNTIEPNSGPIYELLDDEEDLYKDIILINGEFAPDKYETNLLLQYAASGGNVFISTEYLYGDLADTLGIRMEHELPVVFSGSDTFIADSLPLTLHAGTGKSYYIKANLSASYINTDSAAGFEALGEYNQKTNFIRIPIGEGAIYVHSSPRAFTNFVLRDPNDWEYAFRCISYLPTSDVIWDEHYKGYSLQRGELSYVLSQTPLRWAYYVLVIGLLLYIIFESKRRQRIIPVLEPVKNTTLEFVETIGRLYYQNRDHADLAAKKIAHFHEFLHHRLHIRYTPGDKKIIAQISSKAAMPEEKVRYLFSLIEQVSEDADEQSVIELSQKIDEFYKQF
jgi:hypothetical protein